MCYLFHKYLWANQFNCSSVVLISLSLKAFHILNNTTIQFKLEKIPLEKDLDLTFPLCNEDFEISSVMKIEGKFVNPLQVQKCSISTINIKIFPYIEDK